MILVQCLKTQTRVSVIAWKWEVAMFKCDIELYMELFDYVKLFDIFVFYNLSQ